MNTPIHHVALADQLIRCAEACNQCYSADLFEGQGMSECARRCRDCAEMCLLTWSLVTRNSDVSELVKQLCAKICRWCAEECKKHNHDHCQRCFAFCTACAEACA